MIRLTIPEIDDDEIQAVADVLRSGYLVEGKHVQAFEQLVADYVGVRHAVAVSSGTAALHVALLALGVGPGDEVIVPDFTFPATANVVELAGAKPVLVDIDLDTFNIDVTQIRAAITPRTKGIMPVHLFGQPADMEPIAEIANASKLFVVEDAACALGAEYHGRKCGAIGDIGCFSFHPRKAITTGEGGMVVTDDDAIAQQLRQIRNHGMVTADGRHRFALAGFNYRMTDIQGALGVVQMGRLEGIISRRIELAGLYQQILSESPAVVRPAVMDEVRHIWQSYVIMVTGEMERDELMRTLRAQGIESTIGTYAVSAQPHYSGATGEVPNSRRAYEQSLCLPLHTRMSKADIETVATGLTRVPTHERCPFDSRP